MRPVSNSPADPAPAAAQSRDTSAPVIARYLPRTRFADDLHQRVDRYFDEKKVSRRDQPVMYLKTVVILAWMVASYIWLLHAAGALEGALAAVSLALAMASVGFNIQHDGNHEAYSRFGWVNRGMACSLDLLGGSSYFWRFKHNIAHHTHTNIAGQDDDIGLAGAGRFTRFEPHKPFFRFQHFYVWVLYALLAVEWQTTGEIRNFFRRRFGLTNVPRLPLGENIFFWVGRAVFYTLAFVIPLQYHSVKFVLLTFLLTSAVLGFTIATVFQLAHCIEETTFFPRTQANDAPSLEWRVHQVESTANFAPRNVFLTWWLGGLNYQIEHHLFPRICHVHYPALSSIVQQTCREHGVRYFSHRSLRAALRSHWRYVRGLGAPVAERELAPGAANCDSVATP